MTCRRSNPPSMTVGVLREALISAMDLGGAYGRNLGESKPAVVEVAGWMLNLDQVAVDFRNGFFVLALKAGAQWPPEEFR